MKGYVWYVGYGSNLSKQRFLCYIQGGKPSFGNNPHRGCRQDKTLPTADKAITIYYPLYFALPDNGAGTGNWGPGGVAFISPHEAKGTKTLGRMWKITEEQYKDVRDQEGRRWYNKEIKLGDEDGFPVLTITNAIDLNRILCPSDMYLKTIAVGLQEAYRFDDKKIADYLIEKNGIKNNLQRQDILQLLTTLPAGKTLQDQAP